MAGERHGRCCACSSLKDEQSRTPLPPLLRHPWGGSLLRIPLPPRASIWANLVFPTRLLGRWIIPRILFCFFPLFITR